MPPDESTRIGDTPPEDMTRSTRDPQSLGGSLNTWLSAQLGAGANPEVTGVSSPEANGMSSETLLFDAAWTEDGVRPQGSFVARVEPDPNDCPVFPFYDLEGQFRLLQLLNERSAVPVPGVRWLELDPEHLGAPFFVMDCVDGRVPPDVLPYTFGSWLTEASEPERRTLQDSSVALLADLHRTDIKGIDTSFLEFDLPGATPLERHFENQRRYYEWVKGPRRHPIIEQTFSWLENHWPKEEGEAVISWGDSRIGNVLYDGFEPAAALDWEMAAMGPRELDVGWMIFLHCFFQELAGTAGMPGLPDFMQPAEVSATYERLSGHAPRDLEWYQVYAGLRHAIVMARVHARRVHFGQAEWPEDQDSVIYHRPTLDRMLDGSWWD